MNVKCSDLYSDLERVEIFKGELEYVRSKVKEFKHSGKTLPRKFEFLEEMHQIPFPHSPVYGHDLVEALKYLNDS